MAPRLCEGHCDFSKAGNGRIVVDIACGVEDATVVVVGVPTETHICANEEVREGFANGND